MADNISVCGLYSTVGSAENAVGVFKDAGFRNTDVSVLLPNNLGSKDLGVEKASKAPEGAVTGAGSGAVIGGALGWLVGVGMLAIPGIGPVLAAGPIAATLAGIGAGGSVGGILGALIGLGIPEYEAKRYEGRVRSGGILVSIHCDSSAWAHKAKQVFQLTGADDIASTSEARADYAKTDRPLPRESTGA